MYASSLKVNSHAALTVARKRQPSPSLDLCNNAPMLPNRNSRNQYQVGFVTYGKINVDSRANFSDRSTREIYM
jgi:hypothetical protein